MKKFGKRLDGPGGRRSAPRAPVLMSAAMHTIGASRTVSVLDVSKTGAKLRARMPWHMSQVMWLKLARPNVFAKVVWTDGEECGVEFDEPLSEAEAASLQARRRIVIMPRESEKEQLAMADWQSNMAP
jgi:hypothetical protein